MLALPKRQVQSFTLKLAKPFLQGTRIIVWVYAFWWSFLSPWGNRNFRTQEAGSKKDSSPMSPQEFYEKPHNQADSLRSHLTAESYKTFTLNTPVSARNLPVPPCSPHRSSCGRISQHYPQGPSLPPTRLGLQQPCLSMPPSPCSCQPHPTWAAFPLPSHIFKPFLCQTFARPPQRLIVHSVNNQGPSLSAQTPLLP